MFVLQLHNNTCKYIILKYFVRYKLNKVKTADGELPLKVKKDAHDIILDFIRSRPPLKPASRRKLAPLRKYSTPQELLLTDIASENAKKSLRKTSGPPVPKLSLRKYIINNSFLNYLNISSQLYV